jgi:hypothetical protein
MQSFWGTSLAAGCAFCRWSGLLLSERKISPDHNRGSCEARTAFAAVSPIIGMRAEVSLFAGGTAGAIGAELSTMAGAQAVATRAITITSKAKENLVFMGILFLSVNGFWSRTIL